MWTLWVVLSVCSVTVVTPFNLDQVNYAVYQKDTGSMFGFAITVHKDRANEGWVLVGAPFAQSIFQNASMVYRGGAVYRCSARGDSSCEEVPFDRENNAFFRTSMLDDKSQRWLGATLSSSGVTDGPVVACAPRYIWFTKDLNRRDPVGTCFVSNGAFTSFEEYSPCRTS
ncbi:unnamed protein product, partial [Callosobruchus maculatus]